jgi:hypothetical protein
MEETGMVDHTISSPFSQPPFCVAKSFTGEQRRELAVQALSGIQPITILAKDSQVSRKFVYQQVSTARQALDDAFIRPAQAATDVMFYLPVTKDWLEQLSLAIMLHCHGPLRGVQAVFDDVFDTHLSVGGLHNIFRSAVDKARTVNARQDLSRVRFGTHDEIFQKSRPVLVGADVASTYCYLLSLENHRDAETWGVRLLELCDQGFSPEGTVADAGSGLRAGQALAMPNVPCRSDVFHPLLDLGRLLTFLENRAYGAVTALEKQERRMARAKRHGKGNSESKRLAVLRRNAAQSVALADEVALLGRWIRDDILPVAGPDHFTRCQLFDFVVAELEARQAQCSHRIGPVVRLLKNQRDDLLAFAAELDAQLAALARDFEVAPTVVRELLLLGSLDPKTASRWQREDELHSRLGARFFPLHDAVMSVADETVRASSVIENINSRLRNYFFLRRHLGPEYLDLLRFFLNHRRFPRSQRPERVGKSPAELLTGNPHPHWLELLDYQRFQRN